MRRGFEIAILAAGLGVLAVIAFARNAPPSSSESFHSSYDTGANGYAALYNVLAARGVAVRQFERPPALLPPHQTLVVASNQLERESPTVFAGNLSSDDVARIRDYARAGGHVVLIDTDGTLALQTITGVALQMHDGPGSAGRPVVRSAENAGVSSVYAPYGYVQSYRALRAGYPVLGNADGAVAYRARAGKGDVVVLTSAQIFANAHIAQADNMAFAYDLFAGHGTVYFDEYFHGYSEDKTFWQALPPPVHTAVWIMAATIAAVLVGANVRIAPAIPLEPPDERDSSAYVASMARLLRRARAGRAAVRRFADDALRAARHAGRDETAAALAELQQLAVIARPSGAQVRRAAELNAFIRKDGS